MECSVSILEPPALASPKRGHFLWNGPRLTGLAGMTDVKCPVCQGLGWVCENHPTKAWTENEGGCQCGAGMPCDCNRANGEDTPDIKGIIEEVEGEPKMTRH
ncbi:hypothetical protein ABIB81_001870 [Bradyrhizobium sp. I1.7.5]